MIILEAEREQPKYVAYSFFFGAGFLRFFGNLLGEGSDFLDEVFWRDLFFCRLRYILSCLEVLINLGTVSVGGASCSINKKRFFSGINLALIVTK